MDDPEEVKNREIGKEENEKKDLFKLPGQPSDMQRPEANTMNEQKARQITSYGLIVLRNNFDGAAPDGFIVSNNACDCRRRKSISPETGNMVTEPLTLKLPSRPCPSTQPYSVLIVQKRNSHSLCDLVSGRISPQISDKCLRRVVDELACTEKLLVLRYNFETLWNTVSASHKRNQWGSNDFRNADRRFHAIKHRVYSMINTSQTHYVYSELGFPKGRIERAESKLHCAIREFEEETGYNEADIIVPDPNRMITERFEGADGRLYIHTYFIAMLKDSFLPPMIKEKNDEIQNVGWVPLNLLENRASGIFRDYEKTKFEVLSELRNYIQSPESFLIDY